jgi:phosphoglycerate dehydrogenase-like enzyme
MKVAILDDFQDVAWRLADWSPVARRAEITVFNDHVAGPAAIVERLRPFDVVCVMRERTPLSREILQQLPRLKLIASTGPRNASIDMQAAAERGILVTATGYESTPTIELTWALILASARHLAREAGSIRDGGWQTRIGANLRSKCLGVVGLGNIGKEVARIGLAFGMTVIAWSQNLTTEIASAAGATLVGKHALFRQADIATIHLILSRRTIGLVGAAELALMKPAAWLINTSRGPIVDQAALIEALQAQDRRGRARRVRCRALARGSPVSDAGQRAGDAAHRLRHGRALSHLLRRCRRQHRRVARHQRRVRRAGRHRERRRPECDNF